MRRADRTTAIPDVEILAIRLIALSQYSLMYSPDGMNVYGSRGGDFEVTELVWGLTVVK